MSVDGLKELGGVNTMDNESLIVLRQIEAHLREIKEDAASVRLRIIGVITLLLGVIIVLLIR